VNAETPIYILVSRTVPISATWRYGPPVRSFADDKTSKEIESFSSLPKGWDYGDGGPISRKVIKEALFWNRFLISRGILDTEAAPSARGAVLIAATIGGRYTEVIPEPGNKVTITQSRKPYPSLYRRGLPKSAAKDLLLELMGEVWSTSAGFTLDISFPVKGGSGVRLSVTSPATVEPASH